MLHAAKPSGLRALRRGLGGPFAHDFGCDSDSPCPLKNDHVRRRVAINVDKSHAVACPIGFTQFLASLFERFKGILIFLFVFLVRHSEINTSMV